MTPASRPKVVVLGLMAPKPVAGVVWQTLHYLLGLERLGCEAYYVEAHSRAPGMLMETQDVDGSQRAAQFISEVMVQFRLGDRWAFHALHSDGRCYGMSDTQLRRLYREAALILNLHGATQPLPEHSDTGRLVYLETDPVRLQIELFEDRPEAIAFLEPHCAFYTFAELYGSGECSLPISKRFAFRPTRQPVVLDLWETHGIPAGKRYTTLGNWQQRRRDIVFEGKTYFWSKHHEFLKFIDLPHRSGRSFELALSRYEDAERRHLESHGWTIRPADKLSRDIATYRSYVCGSRAEFTVAKDQNVRFFTGWFSDRSATYLAAGRPVVTQDTGFGRSLPTGAGLFPFSSMDDALGAIEQIEADYSLQSRQAHEIARGYFSHEVVLGRLLEELGVRGSTPASLSGAELHRFPDELVLSPTSRRPLLLPEPTVRAVLSRPLPGPRTRTNSRPQASIVVVTFNGLVHTRLCLESLLSDPDAPPFEVVVVDNASTDGTRAYLEGLAAKRPEIRPYFNQRNVGFAAANNQGLAECLAEDLVLLNNDTIVPPGSLRELLQHLIDPDVGLVGPVTNRTCNEAQIHTDYSTYGGLLEFNRARRSTELSEPFDIRMLAMFCVALRRAVFDEVGPLDERFGMGTLEDEDYAIRVREAGYRVVCAGNVFIHHFSHASFGQLIPSGEYHRLLATNIRLFEDKWGAPWKPYSRRPTEEYDQLSARVRDVIAKVVPANATVAVVSKGDDQMLPLGKFAAWHFPTTENGAYAGFHPAGGAEAIEHLEAARSMGVGYLVIPNSSLWWLNHYEGFADHLRRYRAVVEDRDTCLVYELRTFGRVDGGGVD